MAYVIYTSGSTGRPKGVGVPHRGLTNVVRAFARALDVGPGDVLLAVTTPAFDIAVLELLLPLVVGGRLVIGGPRAAADPQELATLVERTGATLLQATPSTWRLLVEGGWRGARGLRALSGGEALPRDLADRLLERCGVVWNGYGPTEAAIYATLAAVGPAGRVTIGRPIDGVRAHVVDRWGNRLPAGVPGELWLGGAGLARGYVGRADLTAERFVPDPFGGGAGERLYRTGDLVRRLPDGELEHLGRIDQQVKVRGHRIEPGEVEAALLSHPSVREAVVVARDIEPGDRRLVAYVVSDGSPAGAEALRPWLRRLLPDYMVPSRYVALDVLPRTLSGKLDRAALPAPGGRAAGPPVEAPRSGAEADLAAIWASALGLERVGVRDDFFALGGHSLLAVRVMAEVERRFGRLLPVAAIFQQGSTVAGLASLLEAPDRPELPVSPLLSPVRAAGSRPPLFVVEPDQRGVMALRHFLPHLDPEQPVLALLPRTSEGRFDRGGSVEELAGELLGVLRSGQPRGPYRLAGYSFGGVLAYDLAGRLREAGEQVEFLVLVDTMAPGLALRHSEPFMSPGTRVRRLLLSPMRRWPGMLWGAARRVMGRPAPLPAGPDEFDAEGAVALLARYRTRPCDVPLTLFSSRWQRRWARDPALGWRGLHAGPLDVHVVRGDHRTMLLQPRVNDLAVRFARRLRAAEPRPAATAWRVSVVIPARNEAANLPHVLARIPRLVVDEVILVDGGSTDGTVEVARRRWPGIRTLVQEGRGKGSALRQGFEAATGDIVVAIDADGSTDPAEIPLYVGALLGGADFVRGSRYLQGGGSADLSPLRSLGNRALVGLVRLLFRNSFSDLCYGYTAFWRRLLLILQPDAEGFEIEAQLSIRALARGLQVYEVPSFERVRIAGRSSLRPLSDGVRVLRTVLAERLHRQVQPPAEQTLEIPGWRLDAGGER